MKINMTYIALSVSALFFAGMANAAITGTSSLKMTFESKVVSGTCTAKLVNGAGTPASEIAFGDVYKSDLVNKTRVEPLKITFSDCSGVKKLRSPPRQPLAESAQARVLTVIHTALV